jgi:hypothetical protein
MEFVRGALALINLVAMILAALAFLYFVYAVSVWVVDEIQEARWERSQELARTSDLPAYFAPMVEEKRTTEPKHRLQAKARHRLVKEREGRHTQSYLEKMHETTKNRRLPLDDTLFHALLDEQKELVPAFA